MSARHKSSRLAYVYVVYDRATGHSKIGFSNDPERREKELRYKHPESVLELYRPGTMALERELHAYYYRQRVRGEWFHLTEDDHNNIRDYLYRENPHT